MTALYHITHIRNLALILQHGCLWCDNERVAQELGSVGIAHAHIKERRARRRVPLPPGGTLADYVPFYFAPRSPMLYAIHRGNVEGYDGSQASVLHLVTSAESVAESGLAYTFTNGHAEMMISDFYADLSHLDQIDWEIMRAIIWRDTNEDGDRKRRRQAEFLVHQCFPWPMITEIGVISSRVAEDVNSILDGHEHRPMVVVHRDWYY